MIAQWYSTGIYDEEPVCRLFHQSFQFAFADIYADTLEEAERKLRILGWRRRTQWEQTEWGYEARLRKR